MESKYHAVFTILRNGVHETFTCPKRARLWRAGGYRVGSQKVLRTEPLTLCHFCKGKH